MDQKESQKEQIARRAGRGFLFILSAKAYFLVAGYAIVVLLSWILGPVLYGVYGLVVGAISVLDNVIITGTIQGVSRFTAKDPAQAGAVKAAALKMQALLGGGVALTFALSAGAIAEFERDVSLTPYLRLAAGVVLFYAFYSVFVGSANGLKRFGLQAGLDALYATIRGGLILGLAAGFLVWGAISGFVIASGLILFIAIGFVGVRDLRGGFPIKSLATFVLPVMAYLLLVNLIMFADLFILKRFAAEALSGLTEEADEAVGVYVAVQQLARVTYQALLAVTFVVFPLVSQSTFDADKEATKAYIGSTMRYSLIFAGALSVIMTALPHQVMGFPFGPAYQTGALALAALAPGYAAFAMFVVATTILNASGNTKTALVISAIVFLAVDTACWVAIPMASTAEELLWVAGACATVAMLLGWLLSALALRRGFGAPFQIATIIRVALAFAAGCGVGHFLPHGSRGLTLLECGAIAVVYIAVLVVTRELGKGDLSRVALVLRRKKSA